jgi:predicted ATPase
MLKEIYIDKYRRFINQKIEFSETMLIMGKNGTGKTTLLELIGRLKRFIINNDNTGHINEFFRAEDIPRWLKDDYGQAMSQFELKYTAGKNENGAEFFYKLKTQFSQKDSKCRIYSEQLIVDNEVIYSSVLEDDEANIKTDDNRNFVYALDWQHSGLLTAGRVSRRIRAFIQEIENHLYVFSLEPDKVGGESAGPDSLTVSGDNFSWWYSNMLTQDIEAASGVLKSYREFLQNCKRAFIDKNTGEFTIDEDMGENKSFQIRFSELSVGQKKLCIYYALFKMLPPGSVFLFDEFENHLSPAELQPLYDTLQNQQDERDFQIILVSHHEKTINWYHDSALGFSLSGVPAHIKVDQVDNSGVADFFQWDIV